jgi:hypothetical protein
MPAQGLNGSFPSDVTRLLTNAPYTGNIRSIEVLRAQITSAEVPTVVQPPTHTPHLLPPQLQVSDPI